MASTPICRCRVLYLGSAVPHITKDGLHGIQEPLRELYPEEGVYGAKGIDSWLSVWSNGLLLENVDEKHKRVTRFFPIESLHYCAAVRHVSIPGADGEPVERFLPLDSPFARMPSVNNPPLFACILRRVAGIKVLECHAFVCKKEMAANALVRCCFHAYADNTYAKHLETGGSIYGSVGAPEGGGGLKMITAGPAPQTNGNGALTVNPIQKVEQWRAYVHTSAHDGAAQDDSDNGELVSIYDGGNENHKVWVGGSSNEDQQSIYADYMSTIRSVKSMNGSSTQRSNRPRQLTAPSSPPPPPPPITTVATIESGRFQNGKKKESKPKERNGRSIINGHNGHPQQRRYPPMSASEFRPVWPPRMRPPQPHGYPMAMLPPHLMGPRLPPGLIPVPPPQVPHRPSHSPKSPKGGQVPRSIEEPIYLPSGRAMSPVASYKPGAFPYEQYYLNQHGAHHPQPHYANAPAPQQPPAGKPTKYKKKKDKDNSDSDSKFNTGIYRKKGHLNERAFSYSIRQEHRSRSHSSLATLSFADPASAAPTNGNGIAAAPTNGALNGHGGAPTTNGHHATNGNSVEHPRTNGKLNGNQGPTSGSNTRNKKKGGKNGVVNNMNELSLSDGEIEEIGTAENNIPRRKAMAANHR